MKSLFKATAFIWICLTVFWFLPATAQAEDVLLNTSADPETLLGNSDTTLYLEIQNDSESPIEVFRYGIDGADYAADVRIEAHDQNTITVPYAAAFDGADTINLNIEINYSLADMPISPVYSLTDTITLIKLPFDASIDFTVTPDRTGVKSGESVDYTIKIKNTGNHVYTDCRLTHSAGDIDDGFSVDVDETATYSYAKSYTGDTSEVFGLTYTYRYDGTEQPVSAPDITVDIDIIHPEMEVTVQAENETVESGQETRLIVEARNTGDTDFKNVIIYNTIGTKVDEWHALDTGQTKQVTRDFTPTKTDTYAYTIKAEDDYGNAYTFFTDEITVTVQEAEPTAPTATPAPSLEETEAAPTPSTKDTPSAKGGRITALLIIFGVLFVLLVATGIVLIVYYTRYKKIKSGGLKDRNVF